MRTKHFVAFLVLLALALPASPAHAGGVVTICDEAHLLAALDGGGTVTFACSGIITLTAEIVISADTTIDGSGQNVTISGNHTVRVFWVNSGTMLKLNWLTIADGSASFASGIFNNGGTLAIDNSTFSGNAGAIESQYGTLTVANSTFTDNRAYIGGAISNTWYNTATVSNSSFSGNIAVNDGGAIFNFGALTVINSSFSDNEAGDTGGAITLDYGSTITVRDGSFSGNSAYEGGGIFSSDESTLTVVGSTFSGNNATMVGGGISARYDGNLTVANSTFSTNSAEAGGGIVSGGTVTVTNSTFSHNSALARGGGISIYTGSLAVYNSTLVGNRSANGGGIYNAPYDAMLTLTNTIVANSPEGGNCSAIIIDGGGNLSYPDATCPGINADPMLGPLQNNGGPTWTMALGPGSAAIDAGIDAICAPPPVYGLDQRGIVRPQGAHCDIGAFEWVCPSFVSPATVGVEDVVAMATRWGWTSSTPDWDPAYDLNLDGAIDVVDVMLVTAGWGHTCS